MKNLSLRWQKLIVWLCGWGSLIGLVVAGGYFYQKSEDEDIRHSVKWAVAVTAIFTGLSMLVSLVNYILSAASVYDPNYTMNTISYCISIIKILVYAVLFSLDFFGKLPEVIVRKRENKEAKKEDAQAQIED